MSRTLRELLGKLREQWSRECEGTSDLEFMGWMAVQLGLIHEPCLEVELARVGFGRLAGELRDQVANDLDEIEAEFLCLVF